MRSIVNFETEIVRPFLCDCSDAYILVTGNIKVQNGNDATRVAIKNCHPFTRASFKLNNEQVVTADNLDLTMNLYNMPEYSDNYADTTGSLYQYKRPEPRDKYQSGFVQKQLTTPNSENVPANTDPNFANALKIWKNVKIVVPLKYIIDFFRNLELPLINTKFCMELTWTKYSVLCNQNQNSIFQITKCELYIPIVTLNTENNNNLSELLSKYCRNNIVGIDLSHQAVLDSDPKINQQIEFVYKLPAGNAAINYDLLTVLDKEKQTVLKFSEGTVKVY